MKNTKRIENKWALVCMSSSVDINTNLLSIYQVIDEITVHPPEKSLPTLPPEGIPVNFPHEFVSVWTKIGDDLEKDEKVKAVLSLIDPNGEAVLKDNVELTFQKGKPNLRYMVKSGGFKMKLTGEYHYELEILEDSGFPPVTATASFLVKIGEKK
jgi:hypothetical protein